MNDDLSDAADRGREKQGPRVLSDELGASGSTSSDDDASSDRPSGHSPEGDRYGGDASADGSNADRGNSADRSDTGSSPPHGSEGRGKKEPTTRFTADLPDSLHREFKIAAAEENRSMKDLMVRILESYLDQR